MTTHHMMITAGEAYKDAKKAFEKYSDLEFENPACMSTRKQAVFWAKEMIRLGGKPADELIPLF